MTNLSLGLNLYRNWHTSSKTRIQRVSLRPTKRWPSFSRSCQTLWRASYPSSCSRMLSPWIHSSRIEPTTSMVSSWKSCNLWGSMQANKSLRSATKLSTSCSWWRASSRTQAPSDISRVATSWTTSQSFWSRRYSWTALPKLTYNVSSTTSKSSKLSCNNSLMSTRKSWRWWSRRLRRSRIPTLWRQLCRTTRCEPWLLSTITPSFWRKRCNTTKTRRSAVWCRTISISGQPRWADNLRSPLTRRDKSSTAMPLTKKPEISYQWQHHPFSRNLPLTLSTGLPRRPELSQKPRRRRKIPTTWENPQSRLVMATVSPRCQLSSRIREFRHSRLTIRISTASTTWMRWRATSNQSSSISDWWLFVKSRRVSSLSSWRLSSSLIDTVRLWMFLMTLLSTIRYQDSS